MSFRLAGRSLGDRVREAGALSTAPSHRAESAEVARAPVSNAPAGMSHREEAREKTQD